MFKHGDYAVLSASDPTGEMVRAHVHVHGVVHTGLNSLAAGYAFVTI